MYTIRKTLPMVTIEKKFYIYKIILLHNSKTIFRQFITKGQNVFHQFYRKQNKFEQE